MPIAAGNAVRDITPEGEVPLFGYPNGARRSTGVHDPLLASALHFRTGTTGIILLSIDLLWLSPAFTRDIRAEIAKATRIREERIFICCTHTHSGPVTTSPLFWANINMPDPDPDYLDMVKRKAVMAASEAAATTTPVEIAWTVIRSNVSKTTDGHDLVRKAGLLAVRRIGDYKFISAVVISDMSPSILNETSTEISADFVHPLRETLKKTFGGEFIPIHMSAPCGDQNDLPLDIESSFESTDKVGKALGQSIAHGMAHLSGDQFSADIAIDGFIHSVTDLPLRELPTAWDLKMQRGDARSALVEAAGKHDPEGTIVRAARNRLTAANTDAVLRNEKDKGTYEEVLASYSPVDVQCIKIGDVFLVGLPGITYPSYAGQIITESRKKCFIISLVNGDLQGCFVDEESYQENQHSVLTSPFSIKALHNIIETALKILSRE